MTHLEAIAKPTSEISIRELERDVRSSPDGVIFSDRDFRRLARGLHQMIDCRVLGCQRSPTDTLSPICEVVLNDSTE